jgi:hypothetical protein
MKHGSANESLKEQFIHAYWSINGLYEKAFLRIEIGLLASGSFRALQLPGKCDPVCR